MKENKYITAKELAVELLKNPDDIVCVSSSNFELNNSTVPVINPNLHRFKGDIKKGTFRDAFDGDTYQTDIVIRQADSTKDFVIIDSL